LKNQLVVPLKPNAYTPISAPVSLKLAQLNTEIPSTISLAEKKEADLSDYAALIKSQKQLFIDQDPRKNRNLTRSGGYSLGDASNETKVEASSFLTQTPFYISNGSEVSQVNRKISTSPFNFSSVDKGRESLDSIGIDK
jgi:hypothetical protein